MDNERLEVAMEHPRDRAGPYFAAVEQLLGMTLVPEVIQAELQAEAPPLDLSWEGTPVWNSAYVTGLRVLATARRVDRSNSPGAVHDPQAFNKRWHEYCIEGSSEVMLEHVQRRAYVQSEAGRTLQKAVRRAAQNILVANNVTLPHELPSAAWADPDGPRARLQHYFGAVTKRFLQSPPRAFERTLGGRSPALRNALLLCAPTGVGKTMTGGNYLASCRVGEVLPDGRRRKAVWVTVTQQLVSDCLNPSKTLQRCLPEATTTTAIMEGSKTPEGASGDVVCVTVQSLEDALREELIKPDEVDLMVFDEAHAALSPRVLASLQQFDCPKLLMTATPSRSLLRSMLKDYHYVRPTSRREAVEEGLLSPVRSLTMPADSLAQAEQLAARAAAELFVSKGKKAVIYCRPGQKSAQARRVAELTDQYCRELMGDEYDEQISYAEMVGSAREDSPESIRAFEAQEHGGVRTTCQMLGVGWDYAELDGCIWIGNQYDMLALEQESGRPLRPKADNREALLIEIVVPSEEATFHRPRYCIAQTFGLEDMPGANFVLGLKSARTASERNDGAPEGESAAPDTSFEDSLSEELRARVVAAGTPIAEILIQPENQEFYIPPSGYSTTDVSLAEQHNLPLGYIRRHLDANKELAAVPYKVIRSLGAQDGERRYQRYYDDAALAERLAADPLPEVSDEHIYSRSAVSAALHINASLFEIAVRELGLPPRTETRLNATADRSGQMPTKRYSMEEFKMIAEWVDRIPFADPSETLCIDVVERFPFATTFLRPEDRVLKRHPEGSDYTGRNYFVSLETLARVEQEHERRTQNLTPLKEVARRAGVDDTVLRTALTPKELETVENYRFTPRGAVYPMPHLPNYMIEDIIERVRQRPLEPFQITLFQIESRVSVKETTLRAFLKKRYPDVPINRVPGYRLPVSVYPMSALQEAEARYGLRPQEGQVVVEPILFDALPIDANSPAEQLLYGRKVQTEILRIPLDQLAPLSATLTAIGRSAAAAEASQPTPPEMPKWLPPADFLDALNCTPAALRVLLKITALESEMRKDTDGTVVSLRSSLIERMRHRRLSAVPIGWVSHQELQRIADEEQQNIPLFGNASEQRLGRPEADGVLDLYYESNLAKQLAQSMKKRHIRQVRSYNL